MTEFDPDEIVQFGGKWESLWTVVLDIMRQPPQQRLGVVVSRDEGLRPSFFLGADIERFAAVSGLRFDGSREFARAAESIATGRAT